MKMRNDGLYVVGRRGSILEKDAGICGVPKPLFIIMIGGLLLIFALAVFALYVAAFGFNLPTFGSTSTLVVNEQNQVTGIMQNGEVLALATTSGSSSVAATAITTESQSSVVDSTSVSRVTGTSLYVTGEPSHLMRSTLNSTKKVATTLKGGTDLSGDVGILGNVHIDGNGLVFGNFEVTGSVVSGNQFTPSDPSIKRKMDQLDGKETIEKLMRLKPISFEYIKDAQDTLTHYGFNAENVKDIYPELVEEINSSIHKRDDGEKILSIRSNEMPAINTKAIQELVARVFELESLFEEQQDVIEILSSRLDDLEKNHAALA